MTNLMKMMSLRNLNCFSVVPVVFMLAFLFSGANPAHADGQLYLSTGSIGAQGSLYMVDTDTAATTYVGPADGDGLALSGAPQTFLYNSLSLTDDPDTGRLSRAETNGSGATQLTIIQGDADRGLAYNTSNGLLYGTDNEWFGIINPSTGAFTPLKSPAEVPIGKEAEALAADPNNNRIYGLTNDSPAYLIFYNIATDTWSEVGQTGNIDGGKGGLAFDPTSNILYGADNDGHLYRINPATAEDTFIGHTEIDTSVGLTFVPEPEPIPSISQWGMILLSLLVAGLAVMRIKRRRA
ncbi:MAG: IPTL-CTERM sorting domain-containing protein [Deltaproteobacteria bacterium]|nr:IPTL-CTERM sorting domain-containing protein [Deltaproteobacteria bacterium]MBW1817186.1 IPTL-CTERM sorting domain-containing protein [Deltaproteobacteria bacterium]